jgi:protein disulfide-isomerase
MKALLTLVLALAFCSFATAKDGWLDNMEAAKTEAKKGNKKILLNFTGSDWCGWCKKLDAEVFSTQEFKDYAAKNLVLVTVDFPQSFKLAAETKKQNDELAAKHKIQGYPTIVLLSSSGTKTGQLGYVPGGPKEFIKALENAKR